MMICVLVYQQVGNYKYRKHDTGYSISRHKGEIHFPKIIGFDDRMLIDQHACKHRNTDPIQPPKTSIQTRTNDTSRTQHMEQLGYP